MRIRRPFIMWPCLYGSLHLGTTTTVSPFHCPFVRPCRYVIMRPSNRAIITNINILHHVTLPPASNILQLCCRETGTTPCNHRSAVPFSSRFVYYCNIVLLRALPCNLVRQCAFWSTTIPPCRRAAALY